MNEELDNIASDCKDELKKIKKYVDKHIFDDMSKYLILYSAIRACGTIERILKMILYNKITYETSDEVENYMEKYILEASFNPKPENIKSILKDMSNKWCEEYKIFSKKNKQKNSDLESLVQLRNKFAHGGSISASIEDIIKYYESGVDCMEELYVILNGNKV